MTDQLHIVGYDKDGNVIKNVLITDAPEPVEFYAHQVRHATGVVRVTANGVELGDAVE